MNAGAKTLRTELGAGARSASPRFAERQGGVEPLAERARRRQVGLANERRDAGRRMLAGTDHVRMDVERRSGDFRDGLDHEPKARRLRRDADRGGRQWRGTLCDRGSRRRLDDRRDALAHRGSRRWPRRRSRRPPRGLRRALGRSRGPRRGLRRTRRRLRRTRRRLRRTRRRLRRRHHGHQRDRLSRRLVDGRRGSGFFLLSSSSSSSSAAASATGAASWSSCASGAGGGISPSYTGAAGAGGTDDSTGQTSSRVTSRSGSAASGVIRAPMASSVAACADTASLASARLAAMGISALAGPDAGGSASAAASSSSAASSSPRAAWTSPV